MKIPYKEQKEYICRKPLTLRHLYTSPDYATIEEGEVWWLVSENKSKGVVTLERKSTEPPQTRCKLSMDVFQEYFEIRLEE